MPDPATQFAPAGIQAGYQYTPVETRLNPPIHLDPVNYGVISQAAQQLGQNIQNSPLFNPLVREKYRLGIASAQTGEQYMKILQSDPDLLPYVGSVQGDEFHTVAGANAGLAYRFQHGTGMPGERESGVPHPTPRPTDEGTTPPPATTDQTKEPAPNKEIAPPPPPSAGQLPVEQAKPTAPPPPVSTSMVTPPPGSMFASAGGAQAPPAPGGPAPVPDQGQINAALAETRVGGNAPLAASTDNDFLMRAAAQKRQAALAQWQQTTGNVGGMSPKQALDWFHGNVSTLGQDATLMPHGGPGGEPAYAFHMKGGGQNIIPISQIVQRGGGPLVTAENTSAAYSQSDKMTGADQQPPYPTIASDQGGAAGGPPPAAAGGPPPPAPGGDLTAALRPYTAVPSQGGPSPEYMMASGNQAVTPPVPKSQIPLHNGAAGVNQGDGSTYVNKDPKVAAQVFAQNFEGKTVQQIKSQLDGAEPDNTKLDAAGNPYRGTQGGVPWYQDKETGVYYAVRPGAQDIWSQSRFPINGDQWIEVQLPTTQLQRNLSEWDPSLSPAQINKMTDGQIRARLQTAYYLKTTGAASDRTTATNNLLRSQILTGRRLLDATAGMLPGEYGQSQMKANEAAMWRASNPPAGGWQGAWQGLSNWLNEFRYGKGPDTQTSDKLKYMQDTWDQLRASVNDPHIKNNISDKERHDNQSSITQMDAPPDMTGGIADWRDRMARWLSDREMDYKRSVGAAMQNNERVFPEDAQNVADLNAGTRIFDPTAVDAAKKYGYATKATDRLDPNGVIAQDRNRRQAEANARARAAATASPTATPTPSATPSGTPTPTVRTREEFENFKRTHKPGTPFTGPDGKPYST